MISSGDRVLVAVSGGIDSVCLLNILQSIKKKLNIQLEVAHLNHMLRGEEAERDASFVQQLCNNYQIPLHLQKTNIKEKSKGRSLQDIARQIRYDFLLATKNNFCCTKIATAHTGTDQAEEILIRLIRGTSMSGLSGIKPKRADCIIRPLLILTRQEILAYAQKNNIEFVEDSSNNSLKYQRNKVRQKLLPIMENFNKSFVKNTSNLAEILYENEEFMEDETNIAEKQCKIGTNAIDIEKLSKIHPSIRKRIYRNLIIKSTGSGGTVTSNHLSKIDEIAMNTNQYSAYCLPNKTVVMRKQNYIYWQTTERGKIEHNFTIPDNSPLIRITAQGVWDIPWSKKKLIIEEVRLNQSLKNNDDISTNRMLYLDGGKIDFPVFIRQRRHGDMFMPFGSQKERHLKHFLNSKKIPLHDRNSLAVMTSDNAIVAVLGVEICDSLKVTNETKKILRISLN